MKKLKSIISGSLAALTIFGYLLPKSYANSKIKTAAKMVTTGFVVGASIYYIANCLSEYGLNCTGSTKMEEFSGIRNLGNTCYLNSALQMLYQIPEIRNGDTNYSTDLLNTMMVMMKSGTSATDSKKLRNTVNELIKELGLELGKPYQADRVFELFKKSGKNDLISFGYLFSNDDPSISNFVNKLKDTANYLVISIDRRYTKTMFKNKMDIAQEIDTSNGKYELKSIVYHRETLNSGHFVTCSKSQNGKWYLCNDRTVSLIGEKPMEDGTGYGIYKFYSHMLLYSKKQ